MPNRAFIGRSIQTLYTGNRVFDTPIANIYMILNQLLSDLAKLDSNINNYTVNNNESDPLSLHLDFWRLDCGVASSTYSWLMEILLSHIYKCYAAEPPALGFIDSEILDCGGA